MCVLAQRTSLLLLLPPPSRERLPKLSGHRLLVFARPRRRGGGWDRPAWVYQWVGTTDCPPSNSRIEKFLQVSESNVPVPPLSEHVPARVPVVKRARGSRRAPSSGLRGEAAPNPHRPLLSVAVVAPSCPPQFVHALVS